MNKKKGRKLCVAAHTYSPSKQEAEAGGPGAQGQLSYVMCLKWGKEKQKEEEEGDKD